MRKGTPKFIELASAVRQIHGAVGKAKGSPFFIVTGAGVSCPEVPLARSIVDQCKKVAAQAGASGDAGPASAGLLEEYSHWLAKAYPDLADRQQYFAGLILGGKISRANFRLAHLLLGEQYLAFDAPRTSFKPLARMVVTTNFDDHLARALKLFGVDPLVCDHPATTTRVDVARDDEVQIIHVHGSYRHYDIVNLPYEMADAAALNTETTVGMANMLDALLKMRTPIVLGYGGWQGDVIMGALERRLRNQRSPRNIYWFCHAREEAYSLPDWLKLHHDVHFVARADAGASSPAVQAEHRSQSERTRVVDAFIQTVEDEERNRQRLEAALVLEELIRTFAYPVPTIIKSPLATLKARLEREFPVAIAGDSEMDLYGLRGVLDRLEQAQRSFDQQRPAEDPQAAALAEMREAVAKANYKEACKIATRELPRFKKGGMEPFSNELAMLCANIAEGIQDSPASALEMWKSAESHLPPAVAADAASPEAIRIAIGEARALADLGKLEDALRLLDHTAVALSSSDPKAKASRIQVLLQRIQVLEELKKHAELLVAAESFLQEFSEDEQDTARFAAAKTLVSKARAERELRDTDSALDSLQQVVDRFAPAEYLPLQQQIAIALGMRSALHGQLRQPEEALRAAQLSIDLFSNSSNSLLERQVVYAQSLKARALAELKRGEEALAIYDQMIGRLPAVKDPPMKSALIAALVDKGTMLLRQNRIDDAKGCFSRVIAEHAGSGELLVQREYCRALRRLGRAQGMAGETGEAIKTYESLIATFGADKDSRIARYVAYARNAMADLFLREAKEAWLKADASAAKPLLSLAREQLLTARTAIDDATIVANLAYERCLSGESEEALSLMREALKLGGKATYEGLKADVERNAIEPDAAFLKELVAEGVKLGLAPPPD